MSQNDLQPRQCREKLNRRLILNHFSITIHIQKSLEFFVAMGTLKTSFKQKNSHFWSATPTQSVLQQNQQHIRNQHTQISLKTFFS